VPYVDLDNGDNYSIDRTSPFTILSGEGNQQTSMGYSGTEGEQRVIAALLSARSGRSADSYPSYSSLVYGPLVKGEEARG
jgi:hypothetical protein